MWPCFTLINTGLALAPVFLFRSGIFVINNLNKNKLNGKYFVFFPFFNQMAVNFGKFLKIRLDI